MISFGEQVQIADSFQRPTEIAPYGRFDLDSLRGRWVEFSTAGAVGSLSLVCDVLVEAQKQYRLCSWVTLRSSSFFPPDFARRGIDISQLVVVRAKDSKLLRVACERLLRTDAFHVVIVDWPEHTQWPLSMQSRLMGLIKKNQSVFIGLSNKNTQAVSMSSMVSLRIEAALCHREKGLFTVEYTAIKDKRRGPHWTFRKTYHGPPGLY